MGFDDSPMTVRFSGWPPGCLWRALVHIRAGHRKCIYIMAGLWQARGRAVTLWAVSGSFTERTLGVGRRQCRSERAQTSENEREHESVRLAGAWLAKLLGAEPIYWTRLAPCGEVFTPRYARPPWVDDSPAPEPPRPLVPSTDISVHKHSNYY